MLMEQKHLTDSIDGWSTFKLKYCVVCTPKLKLRQIQRRSRRVKDQDAPLMPHKRPVTSREPLCNAVASCWDKMSQNGFSQACGVHASWMECVLSSKQKGGKSQILRIFIQPFTPTVKAAVSVVVVTVNFLFSGL